MIDIVFGKVLPWVLVAFEGWLLIQLIRQNGRILLKLEELDKRLGMTDAPATADEPAAGGLEVGTPAPAFTLPDLAGKPHSLAEFRGRKVLLVFFGPRCGYCMDLLPELAKLPIGGSTGKPAPLVVSSGDAEENRKIFERYGVRCPVLLQKQLEVASPYQAVGTPMGYLIDAAGKIASPLAVGSDALVRLIDGGKMPAGRNGHATAPEATGQRKGRGNRPLSTSKLVRDGLKAGMPAPPFRLPRVGGGELALAEFRGRKVLLVFSDPNCGPCDALAPQLEQLHQRSWDLQVLMISRGEADANRKKVAELGLSFPVVLQKQWEISLKYGMFATPIGYLIDERGTLVSDVAVGAEAILRLAPESPEPTSAEEAAGRASVRQP